jgi:TolB-like protein
MGLFNELKRRHVFKVGAAYLIVAWLLLQIIDVVSPILLLPLWIPRAILLVVALGFPVALLLAWAFELTPDGLKPTSEVNSTATSTTQSGHKLNRIISIALALALVLVALDAYVFMPEPVATEEAPVAALVSEPAAAPAQSSRLPNSVAVLPFAALSQDPDDAFFAEGIHDELLNQLAQNGELNVISRTAVLGYASTELPIARIAEELNVETIMEGTIRYGRERIRLTAQLIDPKTGTHLWSNTYDREFDVNNIFEIETDIAVSIARALEAEFSVADRARIATPLTTSTEAWALYRQAMALITGNLNPWEAPETVARFHALLDQALAIDPQFATAHAVKGIDYAFSIQSNKPLSDPRTQADYERLAVAEAERALAIDPQNGLAYMALGLVHHYSRRPEAALQAFETALTYDPNNLDIIDDYARLLQALGRGEEALQQARRVEELAPAFRGQIVGYQLWLMRRFDEARVVIGAMPNRPISQTGFMVMIEIINGNANAARADLEAVVTAQDANPLGVGPRPEVAATQAYMFGRIGDATEAARRFERFQAVAEGVRVLESAWVLASLGIGDTEAALEHLRRAADAPYWTESNIVLERNVYADPILEQPEFVEVRKRLALVPEK